MDIKLINIGFGNIVAANRIISIISPESAPIKRIIQEARDNGNVIANSKSFLFILKCFFSSITYDKIIKIILFMFLLFLLCYNYSSISE